jgi:peptidoglycan hydrolase-like protein with peptidoglycan-binding domain
VGDVVVSDITQTSATVTWTTDEASNSFISYGLTDSYGTSTSPDSLQIEHTFTLTGLQAGATYHFSVQNKDAAENVANSGDTTFATEAAEEEHSSSSHGSGGRSVSRQVAKLTSLGDTVAADALKAKWPNLFDTTSANASVSSTAAVGIRDLELGMTGNDVLLLQKLLNANGFILAASGAGASGSETTYFGALTQAALAKYQAAHGISPAAGYFGPITRAEIKAAGLTGIWW